MPCTAHATPADIAEAGREALWAEAIADKEIATGRIAARAVLCLRGALRKSCGRANIAFVRMDFSNI